MVLTDWQKRCFIRDGYIILRGAVPTPLVESALEAATASYRANKYDLEPQGVAPRFHEEALKHPDIGEIPEKTIIKEACEDLLGAGNVRWGGKAQIAFRLRDEKSVKKGMGMTDLIPRKMYHVDGATGEHSNLASAFTILVGVALSKGQMADENRGQLHVWPGSHVTLHEILKQRIRDGLVDGNNVFGLGPAPKPDVGDPLRVRMRPGDVVIAHQRLGHSGGINLHPAIRKNLYFRIRHKRHPALLQEAWSGSLWTEYESLHTMTGYVKGTGKHSQLLMDMDENVLKTGPQQIDELVPTAYQLRGTGSKVSWDPFL